MSELLSNHLVEHQYLALSACFAAVLLLPLLMRGSCQDGREMGSGKASGHLSSAVLLLGKALQLRSDMLPLWRFFGDAWPFLVYCFALLQACITSLLRF